MARRVNRTGLYREAAGALGIDLPDGDMRHSILIDARAWDGSEPEAYADGFPTAA